MIHSVDQLKRKLEFRSTPMRIISIVPSQTEFLSDLGLSDEVIGITKFCIHPKEWLEQKTKVGGTKNLNIPLIRTLLPDLILANKEENTREDIELLMSEFTVWVSDIKTLNDAINMMQSVASLLDRDKEGEKITNKIKTEFNKLSPSKEKITAAYLIWNEPMMTIGADTFISDIMQVAGFENVFNTRNRYPEITIDDIQKNNPQVLLLSSEPYPYFNKLLPYFEQNLPGTKVFPVDGEMFSWYGSRLQNAPSYLSEFREKIKSAL